MKVLVLGATGGTGREIVSRVKASGHQVVALVRKIDDVKGLERATLIQGDARDTTPVEQALEGCTGVISSIGTPVSPFAEVKLLSTATRVLVTAMERKKIRRLVCITGLGAGDSRGHGGFVFDNLVMPLLLPKVYHDKDRQEQIVQRSGLDWILVRPMVLDDKLVSTGITATTDLSNIRGG